MATSSSFKKSSKGGALIAALLLVVITLLLTTGYVDTLTTENKTAKDNENSQLALYAADAGIQYALEYIRNNSPSSPTTVTATLFSTGSISVNFSITQSGTTCPTGVTGNCVQYTATGTVVGIGTFAQRKVEATIVNASDGNIVQWNEYYI